MTVGAAGLQLVAEGGFFHNDIDHNGQQDRHKDTAVDLRIGEQVVQAHLGGSHTVIGGLIDVTGLGVFHHVLEVADIEHPRHQIGGDPVGHDAGQYLVDVQQRLQQAGDGAPQRAGQHAAQKGQQPDNAGRNRRRGYAQRDIQRDKSAHQVLTGCADVEQARLKGYRHGKAGHDQRRGAEEHIADILGIEAPCQSAGGVTPGVEDTGEDQADAVPDARAGDLTVENAHNGHHDAAHQQTYQNGDQGGDQLFGAVLGVQGRELFFHAGSPAFSARLAPAM